ncbi:MAG TPA: alpha/beta fold hydrolase [Terriglobales bacterium]|nr:alpha/beta fold hydrolase [Terriglobales bacterium]HZR63911.1 alpha/beta fold hydrolase [Terriglobales bacterium]
MKEFEAHRWLSNPHLMTLAGALLPRRIPNVRGVEDRLFEVEPGTQLLARCQWQQERRRSPTLALVHGLEGSSESPYMCGLANRAFAGGFNVLRINQRNCGGTERLSATLYNSGLSADFEAVLVELIQRDRLPQIFFAGYSMGGNLVLKMAGELGEARPHELGGVLAVSPALDLAACVEAISQRENRLYQWHFVRHLKSRLRRKAKLFPGQFELNGLGRVRTVREFDEAITARHCGYRDAAEYYERASALRCAERIAVPTLVVTAKDDPVVPFASFQAPELTGNPWIQLVATERGGHCGFISRFPGPERFWAEAEVFDFCKAHARV